MDVEALFEEHQPALLRYLTRYTGDSEEAADAAQEAYLRLVERPPHRSENVRAWLFTVATNVVRDGWKRQRTAESVLGFPGRLPAVHTVPGPEAAYERVERRRMVRRMLQKLSDKERTMLLMWDEGFSHREIADAVGTTRNSVGPTIARALGRLSRDIRRLKEGFR